MKILATIKHSDIFPNDNDKNISNFRLREAARAVVFDEDNNVALLHVSSDNYHKLPGGGIEKDEDINEALQRESMEEIGCNIEVIKEIGQINQNMDKFELVQKNYCYLAKIIGPKGNPSFTDEETEKGFKIIWVHLDRAISILHEDQTEDYQGKFIVARDTILLEEAKKLVK